MTKKRIKDPPLLIACRENNLKTVRLLLKEGASPDCVGKHRITPLIEAASQGFEKVVDLLLKKKADVNALTTSSESALGYAAVNGFTSIVEKLLKVGAEPNGSVLLFGEHMSALTMSAGRGELATVRVLIAGGANPDGFKEPERPMILAARNGHLEVVKFLLENGGDAKARSRTGKTPLFPFSAAGSVEGVKLLMDYSADVNAVSSNGMTPLMWACRNGHLEVVRLLIKNGADVSVRDTFRQRAGVRDTALAWAIGHKQKVVVDWLIKQKLPFDSKDIQQAKAFLRVTRKS